MAKPGMSAAALARCKRLMIEELGDGRKRLVVTDPRLAGREVAVATASTPQDEERIKRAMMGKHRIPIELVTVVQRKKAGQVNAQG